ncbi:MAG: enoyl-CoA hydratase/isomerase family protein, partial [Caulobacterales bacterium]
MSYEAIRYERQGRVAIVTLNRPERLNALSQSMRDDIHAAIEEAKADDGVRCMVMTGAGRGFCAGADLVENRTPGRAEEVSQAEKLDEMRWMGRFALALHAFDKPLI